MGSWRGCGVASGSPWRTQLLLQLGRPLSLLRILPPGLQLAVGIVHPLAQAQQALASGLITDTTGLQQLALILLLYMFNILAVMLVVLAQRFALLLVKILKLPSQVVT